MKDNGYHCWIQNKITKNKSMTLTMHSANISAISQELGKTKVIVLVSNSYFQLFFINISVLWHILSKE